MCDVPMLPFTPCWLTCQFDKIQIPAGNPLPPVLPIVLYNGDQKWTAATDTAELLPKVPGLVADYLPRLKYLLIDENNYDTAKLANMQNLMAAVIRYEHPDSDRNLIELIEQLNPDIQRMLSAFPLRSRKHGIR
jgi:hypothetical protein